MPILSRRSLLSVPVLVAVGVPVVVACSGEGSSGEGGATVASVSAPAGWQSLSGSVMGYSVTVDVGPLVRMDESTTLLPLRVTRAADDPDAEGLDLRDVWSHYEVKPSLTALRVIDVEGSRVWDPLNSNDSSMPVEVGQSVLCAGVFGAVDVDRVTAMLPMVGSPAVEVLERADAEAALGADVDLDQLLADAAIDLFGRYHKSGLDEAREPVGVESFTRVLDGSAASRTTTTSITTILSSDVTFEFGKYDLTAQADGQLRTVAGQIASYGGGELSVVGHTDDVSDEAFNQTLSEQRAAAVRKRLGELTDLSAWSVTEEGRGKTEPAVQGTGEAARAANRRVVVTITPTGGTATESGVPASASPSAASSSGAGALPEAKGPVGTGPEGVVVTRGAGQATISMDKVVRRGKYLFGTLTVSGDATLLVYWLNDSSAGIWASSREEAKKTIHPAATGANGLDLLAGGLRYSPCDHVRPGTEHHITLADVSVDHDMSGTTGVCVIWPDVGGDTVTLDHAPAKRVQDSIPWRLTDIPVVDE